MRKLKFVNALVALACLVVPVHSWAQSDPTADPSLLAWFKFDDSLDDETGNNTLTPNTLTPNGTTAYSTVSVGNALNIGGSDYFRVDTPSTIGGTSGSVHLRFNVPSLSGEKTLFACGGNGAQWTKISGDSPLQGAIS